MEAVETEPLSAAETPIESPRVELTEEQWVIYQKIMQTKLDADLVLHEANMLQHKSAMELLVVSKEAIILAEQRRTEDLRDKFVFAVLSGGSSSSIGKSTIDAAFKMATYFLERRKEM